MNSKQIQELLRQTDDRILEASLEISGGNEKYYRQLQEALIALDLATPGKEKS